MREMWDVAEDAGVPAETRARMEEARVDAGECDYFEQFNGCSTTTTRGRTTSAAR
jgi:hypothetical protein